MRKIFKKNIFNIIGFLIFTINIVKLDDGVQEIPNFKSIYFSNNYYYIINSNGINYYDGTTYITFHTFIGDKIITSEEESEMISFGVYKNNLNVPELLIVKKYLYFINKGTLSSETTVDEIIGYSSEIYPIKCMDDYNCYFVIGLITSDKELKLYLYKSNYNNINMVDSIIISNTDSENVSCLLILSDTEVLICFNENNNIKEIVASYLSINTESEKILKNTELIKSKANNGAKIIKSFLSQDNKKCLVCYINDDKICECSIYDITTNEWSNSNSYLDNCLTKSSSLNIEYLENFNEYNLYCFQSPLKLMVVKLNENFEIIENDKNGIYDFTDSFSSCSQAYLSSISHESQNINLFVRCNENIYINSNEGTFYPYSINSPKITILPEKISPTIIQSTILLVQDKDNILTTHISQEKLSYTASITTSIISTTQNFLSTTIPSTYLSSTSISKSPTTIFVVSTIISNEYLSTISTYTSSKIINIVPTTNPINNSFSTYLSETSTISKLSQTSSIIGSILPNTESYLLNSNPSTYLLNTSSTVKEINYTDDFQNKIIIIQKKTEKKIEEILENLKEIMEECDNRNIYEIFGDNYDIKISPINNKQYKNISTYIDFMSCENKLRKYYKLSKDDILIVFLIEINKNNSYSLISQVEYAIFDDKKIQLNLSICSSETIKIDYNIKNFCFKISSVYYFSNMGVDIFNIKDDFFNDKCFPYFERNSDIILEDRVKDIYQNYSLCDSNCKYEKMDIYSMSSTCICSVKTQINISIEEPTLNKVFFGIFEDSTIGVIKCFKLFLTLNKEDNIGFWIFSFLILLNILFIVYYFKYKDQSIKQYINEEMIKYHYLGTTNNPIKKKIKRKQNINNNKIKYNNNYNSSKNKIYNKNIYENDNINTNENSKENNFVIFKRKTNKNKTQMSYKPKKKVQLNDNLNSSSFIKINKTQIKKKKKKKKLKRKESIDIKQYINSNFNKYYNIIPNFNTLSNFESPFSLNVKKTENNLYNNTFPKYNALEEYSNNQNNSCIPYLYTLIKIDANNGNGNNSQFFSKYNLYDDLEEAIIYEKRNFCNIFFIAFILKEKIINTFFFKSPLELQSLRINLLLFIYSNNFALNTLFYFSRKISDKYHYKKNDIFLFTLINNISICLISTLLSTLIILILKYMTNSKKEIEKIFREEEKKLKKNKNYFVSNLKRKKIYSEILKILKFLRKKIIIFFIFELNLSLFFFYFVSTFCEVFKKTQIDWLINCIFSLLMSIAFEILISFIIAIIYIISIKAKNKYIYRLNSIFL